VETYERDGLVFDVSDAGDPAGEVVVLLHGWPQDRTAWRDVTSGLTASGLRVLAPDQRGYSPRARPAGRHAYRMTELVADVEALVTASGAGQVHLVGHDWGGAVAWALAERHPGLLRTLTVLSTPHHRALATALPRSAQALRSWYILGFQVPWLPEVVLGHALPALLRGSGLPEDHTRRYAARMRDRSMLSASLAWYRAIALHPKAVRPGLVDRQPVSVPTTYVWGRHDPALGREAAELTAGCVEADYRFVELDAGHWLPETRSDDVVAAILSRAGGGGS
jgi:pimeloyl-ACP methyl ester carboxylesterase